METTRHRGYRGCSTSPDAFNHPHWWKGNDDAVWGVYMVWDPDEVEWACYSNDATRRFVVLATLGECARIFNGTSIIQHLDRISFLHGKPLDGEGLRLAEELHIILRSLDSRVLDAVHMSICFENFFKMKLLLDGYVIHYVDKNKSKTLASKQLKYPIERSEFGDDIYKFINMKQTIGWKLLVLGGYKEKLCMPPELFDSLEAVVKRRNNLHYLIADNKWLSGTRLDHLFCIRDCYREYVVKLQNELLSEYEVPPVVSNRRPIRVLGPLWSRLLRIFQ
jgi:hypothetical protein